MGGILHAIAHDQIVAPAGHVVATGVVMASFVGWFTPPVALFTLILSALWYCITIYETATFQKIISWFKEKIKIPKL